MHSDPTIVEAVRKLVFDHPALDRSRLFVLGICGSQGSGKSTLSALLQDDLTSRGLPAAVLSLDDIYKSKTAREAMGRLLHPLLRTRGVPSTHDVALALDVLSSLERGEPTALPRFDKAADDRADRSLWGMAPAGTRVLILEGWFVGARPAAGIPDDTPLNALEAEEDPHGAWRHLVEQALRDDYQVLFSRLDALVLLAAPNFEIVLAWRRQQEDALRAAGRGGMTDDEIGIFVQHYERLTRRILAEMPDYSDLVIALDEHRRPVAIRHHDD
jgi:D-glycerate 3-kinase